MEQIKYVLFALKKKFKSEQGEFGMGAIISIAVGLIVTSFIILPNIQTFATAIMTDMQDWWSNSISPKVFPTA